VCSSDLVMRSVPVIAVFWCLLLPAATLLAQEATPVAQAAEEYDLGDLIRAWRKKPPPPADQPGKRMILAAPIIGSNPSAGFLLGAAAQIASYRGDPATTRISSGIVSLAVSTKKQVLFNVRFDSFSSENRWHLEGDNRFQSTSQNIYGFGTGTSTADAVNTDFSFARVYETLYRRVAKDVYVGGGFLFDSHTSVAPADASNPDWPTSPYIAYSEQHGFPVSGQQSSGVSANVLFNRRDNDISPRRGWLADASYRMSFDGFLGGDSSWQQLNADVRGYFPLDRASRHRIAVWGYTSLVTNGVAPYFEVPTTVMDTYGRSARGYEEGRYRGEQLVYGEIEYRGPLTKNGLLGMVAFTNLTTVTDKQTGEKLFDSLAPAGGGGLRLLLNKRSHTNLCLDLGWGKAGAKGVYLGIQDAF